MDDSASGIADQLQQNAQLGRQLSQNLQGIGSQQIARGEAGTPPASFNPLDTFYYHANPFLYAVQQQLLQNYAQGKLFPAQEAALNLGASQAKAEVNQTMAQLGLSQSSMNAMLQGSIDIQRQAAAAQLLNQGLDLALKIQDVQMMPVRTQLTYSLGLIDAGMRAYGYSVNALQTSTQALAAAGNIVLQEQQEWLGLVESIFSSIGSTVGTFAKAGMFA